MSNKDYFLSKKNFMVFLEFLGTTPQVLEVLEFHVL